MTTLLENPVPTMVGGLMLTIILIGSWLKTGHRSLLAVALVVVALAIGLLVAERMVLTDREQVEQTLQIIARDVESGDLERMLSHVHPEADDTRDAAAREIPQYRIKSVRIKRGVEVKLNLKHDPPEATADFNVVVEGADTVGLFGERQVPRFVSVRFWKDGDRWKVKDYRHADPLEGMRRRD